MGRFFFLSALLLGLIGAAGVDGARPKYPDHPNEGCLPGQSLSLDCPDRMECLADAQYKNGGRCFCNPMWFKIPAKIPFNDLEFDDGFETNDCVDVHLSRAVFVLSFILLNLFNLCFLITAIIVVRELIKAKAYKRNATGISLMLMTIHSIGLVLVLPVYVLNMLDWDKDEVFFGLRRLVFGFIIVPCEVMCDTEIAVTWIDLYDRTKKMSKSSSKVLKVLRYAARFISIGSSLIFVLFSGKSRNILLLCAGLMPIWGILFISIGGYQITKSLCPDRNDVANPNWKVAESIRRGVKLVLIEKVAQMITLIWVSVTGNHLVLGYLEPWGTIFYWFFKIFRNFAWIHYLIYGNRKHLKNYSNENVSAYFGFSTIGLNKTLTTASSRMSSMSSAVSTRSEMPADE